MPTLRVPVFLNVPPVAVRDAPSRYVTEPFENVPPSMLMFLTVALSKTSAPTLDPIVSEPFVLIVTLSMVEVPVTPLTSMTSPFAHLPSSSWA